MNFQKGSHEFEKVHGNEKVNEFENMFADLIKKFITFHKTFMNFKKFIALAKTVHIFSKSSSILKNNHRIFKNVRQF